MKKRIKFIRLRSILIGALIIMATLIGLVYFKMGDLPLVRLAFLAWFFVAFMIIVVSIIAWGVGLLHLHIEKHLGSNDER